MPIRLTAFYTGYRHGTDCAVARRYDHATTHSRTTPRYLACWFRAVNSWFTPPNRADAHDGTPALRNVLATRFHWHTVLNTTHQPLPNSHVDTTKHADDVAYHAALLR